MVVEVKENQESHPIFLELKGAVNNQKVEDFSQGGYGVLRYQGRLCVPDVETCGIIYLQRLKNPGILFIQVPLRCIATSGSLLVEWHEEGYKRHC